MYSRSSAPSTRNPASSVTPSQRKQRKPMNWTQILPEVWRFRDSCNVYAIKGDGGMLIVDAGTGRWLESLDALPAPPVSLVCTHYFRDHSAGAARAAERGIRVYVPEGEEFLFADPE